MPGLVKIGRTSSNDITTRLTQLYTTGVPFPFKVEFACKVTNPDEVEAALHAAFVPSRVNPRREFFQIDPEQAIAILKLLHTEDATEQLQHEAQLLPIEDQAAADQFRARRPNLNFEEMGILVGEVLSFNKGDAMVVVAGPRKVTFGVEDTSLTAVTKQLLGVTYSINPGPFWTYKGRTISAIYNATYNELS